MEKNNKLGIRVIGLSTLARCCSSCGSRPLLLDRETRGNDACVAGRVVVSGAVDVQSPRHAMQADVALPLCS